MDLVACSKGFTSTIRYLTYINWVICIRGPFVAVVNIRLFIVIIYIMIYQYIYIEYTMYVH